MYKSKTIFLYIADKIFSDILLVIYYTGPTLARHRSCKNNDVSILALQSLLICVSSCWYYISHSVPFYPRPVLAFEYCHCLRLSVCMCVSVCVCVCVSVNSELVRAMMGPMGRQYNDYCNIIVNQVEKYTNCETYCFTNFCMDYHILAGYLIQDNCQCYIL